MSRRNARQMFGPEAVLVQCMKCQCRLAMLWPTTSIYAPNGPSWDGPTYQGVKWQHGDLIRGPEGSRARQGMKDLLHADWNSVTCPKCGVVWQGRDQYLHDLLRSAPGGRVLLGAWVKSSTIDSASTRAT